jgi:2-C-methyl-D-erythritol 2,4-cyclodiphosphate synthase
MRKNIADTLKLDIDRVNVKATTEEGLGFTGTEEGISSQAICMLNGFYESSMVVGGGSKCAGCPGCSRS